MHSSSDIERRNVEYFDGHCIVGSKHFSGKKKNLKIFYKTKLGWFFRETNRLFSCITNNCFPFKWLKYYHTDSKMTEKLIFSAWNLLAVRA